jgi:AcrR family transcriptional regulator
MEQTEKNRGRIGWELDQAGRQLPGGTERRDAARNRRVILETARALFGERGVTGVTMEEIARTAAVGKGTLYRRFPNKGLLCQALLDEPTRRLQGEVLADLGDASMTPLEKLGRFLERLVAFTEENLDLLYGGHETLAGADRLAQLAHPSNEWRRGTVLGLLRLAQRSRKLEAELDAEYLADALLAPLDVDLYYYQRKVRGTSSKRIADGLRSLVPG